MPVFGFLHLLFEFACLAEGREFGLLGLVEQSIGFHQPARVERALRRTGQLRGMRVVRCQCRQLVPRLREMARDLHQPRWDFLFPDVCLTENFKKLGDGILGEPKLRRQLCRFCLGLCPGLSCRGHLVGKSFDHRG